MSLIDDAIAAAHRAGIDPNIFVRQIQQESNFNPNAVSPAGAEGIAQFMPGTARGLGINPFNPVQALYAAAQYMANSLRAFGGDYAKALAAYNAGGGAVNYAIARGGHNWRNYLPAETQNYLKIILGGKGNPPSVVQPHEGQPYVTNKVPHTPQPQAFSVPQQPATPAPKPKTIFGVPVAFSVPRQPSVPVAKPKATRPSPAPKPAPKPVAAPMTATQKKSLLAGKLQVKGPH